MHRFLMNLGNKGPLGEPGIVAGIWDHSQGSDACKYDEERPSGLRP